MNGEKLKELRLQRNKTQQQLADDLGISDTYIRVIEKGQKIPSLKVLETLSKYFNVPVSYFTDDEEDRVESSTVENFINKLIKAGIITDPLNVDKETQDMIMLAVKTEIDRQLKEERKKD